MTTVRVAAVQHDIVWHDREANFAHLSPMIAGAAASGARVVLLTETFSTGFSFDSPDIAEPEGGLSSRFIERMATTHGVWVGGSCPEIAADAPADDQRPSNVFVLVAPDGTSHRYRKIHPFSHADEERYVRAGTDFVTVDIDGLRCALFVCYDLRFADEFWALADDVDAYLVVANWPAKRRLHWSTLLRASGGGLDYCGDSAIIDPAGEVLATGAGGETVLLADLDAAHVASTRSHFRFLQDRR
jgi:predicted amidohydrolase